jgi:hypothetical protein
LEAAAQVINTSSEQRVLVSGQMNKVIVDIDNTLINTGQRMHKLWSILLGREIPMDAVETMGLEQIFMKFATEEQLSRAKDFQKRYWDLLLCLDEAGIASFQLHEPIPYAVDVLQRWNPKCEIVYLTGRTENIRSLTLNELEKFGFPAQNTQLAMFKPEDYARPKGEDPSAATLVDTRFSICSAICASSDVVRVVDDYPGYFPLYQQLEIPDRIGFLRLRYKPQHYLYRGATRVVVSWKELQNDLPKAI